MPTVESEYYAKAHIAWSSSSSLQYRYDTRNSFVPRLLRRGHLTLWAAATCRHCRFPFWHSKINFKIHHQSNLTPLYASLLSIAERGSGSKQFAQHENCKFQFSTVYVFFFLQKWEKCFWRLTVHSKPSTPRKLLMPKKNKSRMHHKREIAFRVDRAHISANQQQHQEA